MLTLNKFLVFIKTQNLFQKRDRLLLAVSGGVDSMVMCDLFLRAGFSFGIAHVNFQLRGTESDEDQVLVKNYAEKNGLPFFTQNYPTQKLAEQGNKSIQMVARELRYEWLEQIRQQEGFHFIVTAHHLNDSLETILYNWTKGAGLKGLTGIPARNGYIVRPLLGLLRVEIEQWADENKVPFREDASNREDKYARNKIRQHVFPVLKALNPNLEMTVAKNMDYLQELQAFFEWAAKDVLKKIILQAGGKTFLHFNKLENMPGARSILYEWLSGYGFNGDQVRQIWESRHHQAGAVFYTDTHQLLIDRATFILQKRIEKNILHQKFTLKKDAASLSINDSQLIVEHLSDPPENYSKDANVALIDADQLVFPLTIRRWQAGDHFCPLGMDGHSKKVQDFFTDKKMPRTAKEEVWIVEDHKGRICWIVGHRLDERFKITPLTNRVVKLIYKHK